MDFNRPDFNRPSVAPMHWIAAASLVLAACTTLPPLEYPPDHPANPTAPAAAAMPTSNTLTRYRSFADGAGARSDVAPNADQDATTQTEQPSQEGAHERHH